MSGHCVATKSPRAVGFDRCHRVASLVGKKIVLQKIRLHHRFTEPCFSFSGARIDFRRGLLAGMTARTAFGEDPLASGHHRIIAIDEILATGCVGQMKRLELAEKGHDLTHALLGRLPENRVLVRIQGFKRLLARASKVSSSLFPRERQAAGCQPASGPIIVAIADELVSWHNWSYAFCNTSEMLSMYGHHNNTGTHYGNDKFRSIPSPNSSRNALSGPIRSTQKTCATSQHATRNTH